MGRGKGGRAEGVGVVLALIAGGLMLGSGVGVCRSADRRKGIRVGGGVGVVRAVEYSWP